MGVIASSYQIVFVVILRSLRKALLQIGLLEEGETLAAKGYLLFRTLKHRRRQTQKNLEVIRRNGKKVPWNPEKIFNAIYKAFLAQSLEKNPQPTEEEIKHIAAKIKILPTEKSLADKQVILDISCAIQRDKVRDFQECLEKIKKKERITVKITGPLPLFSFLKK